MNSSLLSLSDQEALASWNLGTVSSVTVPVSGSVNRTFVVGTSTGAFALRISCRERDRVAWEHECIAYADKNGVPVCRPIRLPNGDTFLEHDGTLYSLFPLAIGRQIVRSDLSDRNVWAAGECLARIHAAFSGYPQERAQTKKLIVDIPSALASIPLIEAAIQALPIRTKVDAAALQQLSDRRDWLRSNAHIAFGVQERLDSLPKTVVHGDFQETNLFFEQEHISAVIDWDQSGLAARGWEVMRALHLMLGLQSDNCRAFLGGYLAVLPLPEDEMQRAATCYGVLADSNLWVYSSAYLEGNARAKQFITADSFVPFQTQWETMGRVSAQ